MSGIVQVGIKLFSHTPFISRKQDKLPTFSEPFGVAELWAKSLFNSPFRFPPWSPPNVEIAFPPTKRLGLSIVTLTACLML